MSFRPNSRILAYHGPLIYEARVIRVHGKNKSFVEEGDGTHSPVEQEAIPSSLIDVDTYYVHYKGWNGKWDEWVPELRILEINDANLAIQKKLREAQRAPPKLKLKMGKTAGKSPVPDTEKKQGSGDASKRGRGRKRGDSSRFNEVYLPMPTPLKHILVDDWEYITKDHKLLPVPATVTVSKILQKFAAQHRASKEDTILHEYVTGLEFFFNRSLSLTLLYKVERLQYLELRKEHGDIAPADYYGVEHLLRLCSLLPGLVAQTTMDGPSLGTLVSRTVDLLEFISVNMEDFANEYYYASPAYDAVARA